METVVTRFLSERGIPYKIKRHPLPAYNCEDAARERGVRVSQIVKCMVGMDVEGGLHVMLIPGDRILKLKKVRSLAGGIRIDLVCRETLAADFDVTVGAISPTQFFGLARFYMDHSVFLENDVDISSGDLTAGVELDATDLEDLLGAVRCDIVSASGMPDHQRGHARRLDVGAYL
jgi:prolyl-tRNA editing enzyme YbaK/EbsC (Cys-tRNA(Pro) deacylase)